MGGTCAGKRSRTGMKCRESLYVCPSCEAVGCRIEGCSGQAWSYTWGECLTCGAKGGELLERRQARKQREARQRPRSGPAQGRRPRKKANSGLLPAMGLAFLAMLFLVAAPKKKRPASARSTVSSQSGNAKPAPALAALKPLTLEEWYATCRDWKAKKTGVSDYKLAALLKELPVCIREEVEVTEVRAPENSTQASKGVRIVWFEFAREKDGEIITGMDGRGFPIGPGEVAKFTPGSRHLLRMRIGKITDFQFTPTPPNMFTVPCQLIGDSRFSPLPVRGRDFVIEAVGE